MAANETAHKAIFIEKVYPFQPAPARGFFHGENMTSLSTSLIQGTTSAVAVKAPVKAATTANITLSAAQTIDGVSIVADDRVLVKNQTDTTENGIYIASSSTWERALDFDGSRDAVTGTRVFVISGTTNALTEWYVSTSSDPDPGDAMAFTQVTVPATISVTGLSAETSPASDDLLILSDTSESAANNKITLANFMKIITALSAETAPAVDDELALYDTSGASTDKITLANLLKVITNLTAETAVDDADEIAIYDESAGTADKATVANVLKATTTLTDTVIAATDEILFCDVSDSNNAKKDTVQGIIDLVTATGGWIPIKTITAANDATMNFVNGVSGVVLDSTYKAYVVVLTNIVPATDGADLVLRTSTDAGSTFAASSDDYEYQLVQGLNGSVTSKANSTTATYILLFVDASATATNGGVNGIVQIDNPSAANKITVGITAYGVNSSPLPSTHVGMGYRNTAADVDAIRFLFDTGNITSGTFTLYGLKGA